jgi:hypothetical protein
MTGIRKHASGVSTCGLIVAVATFLFYRNVYSHAAFFIVDPQRCFEVRETGFMLDIFAGALWFGASVLALWSVILGIAARKLLPTFAGGMSLAILYLNIVNLLVTDRGLVPEHFAVQNLRTINIAEVIYPSKSNGRFGSLSDLVRQGLLDSRFEEPAVRNYVYTVSPGTDKYLATATPTDPNSPAQGCWEYYSTEDGLIHYSVDPQKAPPGLAGKRVATHN